MYDKHAIKQLSQLLPTHALARVQTLHAQIQAHNPQMSAAEVNAAVWQAVQSMGGMPKVGTP